MNWIDIFWPETVVWYAGGSNLKQYRSCAIYIIFDLAIFSNVLVFWLKKLFWHNFDQIFILISGCTRNTWWASSSDPKKYRSCQIYRWSIDDRWGRWWKQHPNLYRWSHVHGWKGILMGLFFTNFWIFLVLSLCPLGQKKCAVLRLQRNSDGIFPPEFWFPSKFLTSG